MDESKLDRWEGWVSERRTQDAGEAAGRGQADVGKGKEDAPCLLVMPHELGREGGVDVCV